MKLNAKELIQLLLTKEGMTQKDIARMLTNRTGKTLAPSGLSRKLSQGTITYNEVLMIADILGYDLTPIKRED